MFSDHRVEFEQRLRECFVRVDHAEADRLLKLRGEGFSLLASGVDLDLQRTIAPVFAVRRA